MNRSRLVREFSESDSSWTKTNTTLLGRLLLSLVLLATIVALIGFTWIGWTGEHVFNPEWHPHARFHAAQLVGFGISMSLIELWVVWHHSLRPRLIRTAVIAFPVLFWASEFFAFVVSGTSPSPHPATPNTFQLAGVAIHGNLFFAGVLITLSGVSYLLLRRGE